MPVEPALASRGPLIREESAIQLFQPADVWPPLDQEPAPGHDHVQPRAPDPGPVFPRQFAVFLIEGLAGVRPVRQLMPWMSKRGSAQLHRLLPLFTAGHRPRVLRVLTTRPAPDVIEMTVIAAIGQRTRALAIRLERAAEPSRESQRWLCTDIEGA